MCAIVALQLLMDYTHIDYKYCIDIITGYRVNGWKFAAGGFNSV